MKVNDLIRAGLVRRWHANPDLAWTGETNGHHQWTVAALIAALHPAPSANLLREALLHDVGEVMAGDLPYPFKQDNPEIARAHAAFERAQRERLCAAWPLTIGETTWLELADRLAAHLWMLAHRPGLAVRDGWPEAREGILAIARKLFVQVDIEAILTEAEARG
ncbi:HD domain-containing protein [Defluviimonas sp. WL0002]|uniref:HD domain-containing protein n=1 Tax=Albidovulum marisflavi TaxID=2984159 RepID=A0ABT2ZHP4_9RHOB|nr:HD domain-containing protein [Defluviimonas sp. WL0002]MCV2870654.1 HD domain-containing protein [Defluviimonas sp. WL0002]